MKRLDILIFTLLFLASCETPYDLEQLADHDIIVLDCILVPGDTTHVNARAAIPVGDYGERTPVSDIDVTLSLDGEEIYVQVEDGLFFLVDLEPGQRVGIKAEAAGVAPVCSETVVPRSTFGNRFETVGRDEGLDIIELRSGNGLQEGEFFGVETASEITSEYYSDGQLDSIVTYPALSYLLPGVDGGTVDDSLFGDPDKLSLPVFYINGHSVYMISEFEDGRRFRVPNDRITELEYRNPETGVMYKIRSTQKVSMRFWAISEEIYKYKVKGGNSFSEMGLTSPSYVYTGSTASEKSFVSVFSHAIRAARAMKIVIIRFMIWIYFYANITGGQICKFIFGNVCRDVGRDTFSGQCVCILTDRNVPCHRKETRQGTQAGLPEG